MKTLIIAKTVSEGDDYARRNGIPRALAFVTTPAQGVQKLYGFCPADINLRFADCWDRPERDGAARERLRDFKEFLSARGFV